MKKLHVNRIPSASSGGISLNIAIMVIFFLCGVAAGCIFSVYTDGSSNNFLFDSNLQDIATNGARDYSFAKTFFNLIKYPTIIFLLGFTILGIIFIPITVLLKGFFIAFSVSFVIQSLGKNGLFPALAMFGLQTFISIPCILVLSAFAFEMSKLFTRVFQSKKSFVSSFFSKPGLYIMIFLFSVVLLLIFTLLDTTVTPALVSIATKNI